MFVVFDLDGTLTDAGHREHFVQRPKGQKDWESFHANGKDDPPKLAIVTTYLALTSAGHRIDIWTGRDEAYRAQTELWLGDHGISGATLRMRPTNDHTEDFKMKAGWYDAEDNKPELVFEDRRRVVDMWRAKGVTCCQVAPGDF